MRIGVDFRLVSGGFQGSRRYLIELYRAICQLDETNDYYFCVDREEHSLPVGLRGNKASYNTLSGIKQYFIAAPNLARKQNFDWYHFQHFAPPYGRAKVALTVHDILYRSYPQYFTRGYRTKARAALWLSLHKASVIFVPSEFTKRELEERYSIPSQKIVITPNGVDRSIFTSVGKEESRELIRQKYGYEGFMLTVGRLEPRKNHATLIKAYSILKEKYRDLPRLVVIGQRTHNYEQIFNLINSHGLDKDIIIIEDIGDEMLPHFYRASLLFIYPSFAEGFGIPPLEAMASSCAVITSGSTALPEVTGSAGLVADPYSIEDLADKMDTLLNDQALRLKLGNEASIRADNFTWAKSAQRVLTAYH